jgi:flagellar biosynthesis/type III secretory pathway M-ring protein FliF/YscJ
MFEDLNWRWAARRAAVVIGIYVALLYVLSNVSPETFGLQSSGQIISLLINAVLFFLIFTFVYAYVDRSRRRRLAETSKKSKEARPAGEDSEGEPGALKGRPNPNTSRRKARRRR